MKKIIVCLAALSLVACGQPYQQPNSEWVVQDEPVEQEDCDYEDALEGDEDCTSEAIGAAVGGAVIGSAIKSHKKKKAKVKSSRISSRYTSSSSRSSFRSSSRRR